MGPILVGLDRDGTINYNPNEDFGKEHNWKEILELYPSVVEGIKLLNTCECKLVIASNQSAVARGVQTIERVFEVNKTIDTLLSQQHAKIDSWQFCPYVSQQYALDKGLSLDSPWILESTDQRLELRKPMIGMLREGAKEIGLTLHDFFKVYFIGDLATDVQTGLNAGGLGILVLNGLNRREMESISSENRKHVIANNFYEAARLIIHDIERPL